VAGRDRPELEALIGFFVNTLVLRTDLHGDPPFGDLLQRVRASCLAAYAHQDLPFERLVEALRPERSLAYNPVCQGLFAFQALTAEDLDLPGVRATLGVVPSASSRIDLVCELYDGPEGIQGGIEYATDLFDASDMARLAEHYRTLAEGAAA